MRQLIARVRRRLFRPSETLDGYEQSELVDVIFRKTMAYNPQGDWPEMRSVSSVLDFGGGCGLHYKQANSATVRWAVVETTAMVDRAKELSTDRLQFFTNISDAAGWLGGVDVMHSAGALQYVPNPSKTLAELCSVGAKTMLWHRMNPKRFGMGVELQKSLLSDNGPGESINIKDKLVSYRMTRIPESDFLAAHSGYKLAERGPESFRFVKLPE